MTISHHCRIAVFDQMIIALDLKRSRYFLYDKECADCFASRYIDLQHTGISSSIQPLIDDRVIFTESSSSPSAAHELISDYRTMTFESFDTGNWGSRTLGRRSVSGFEASTLFRVVQSAIMLKVFGLGALSVLEKQRPNPRDGISTAKTESTEILERYLSASMWSPLPITCLPLSFSLTSYLMSIGIPAQLVIGVRPTPFVAHAWVEINECVYGDEPNLKESYGEIFRIPQYKKPTQSRVDA